MTIYAQGIYGVERREGIIKIELYAPHSSLNFTLDAANKLLELLQRAVSDPEDCIHEV